VTFALSPTVRYAALLALLAAVLIGGGMTMLGHGESSAAATPHAIKHHPFGVGLKKQTAATSKKQSTHAAKPKATPPVSVAPKAHAFAAAHWFHSRTEAGYWLIANGLIVTWWVGFSVTSSLLPMMKLPPRSTFISGSRTAAVNAVVGVAGDAGCGGNAACFPAGATEGAGWVWGAAGGVTGDAGPMAWVWDAAGGVAGDAGGEG